jgi:hypothetical protein
MARSGPDPFHGVISDMANDVHSKRSARSVVSNMNRKASSTVRHTM